MSTRLVRSAGLIGAATMTSRVLGVVRETVLAALFGAGNDMDAFNVAFRIPNLLRDLFAEGAMSAAFVATFTRHLATRGRAAAWRLGNLVMNALVAITVLCVVGAWVFAPGIVRAIAPEYAAIPGKLDLTIILTRIMLPFIPLVALSVAMMGMLNSLRRFFVPALSPAMFNVATIAAAFTIVPLMPRLGWPRIAGIAIGTLIGGLGQIVLQWPVLRREGWRYAPVLENRDPGLREVLLLMAPGTLGLAAVQVNVFVNTVLATGEGTGAVSWLNYAFRIMYLPIGLFGASIGTAALPEIARHAAVEDLAGMRRTVSGALRLMLMLNIPATVGLLLLAHPIVAMLLERGRFGPADSAATAAALMCYAPGLIGYSTVKIASPSFYSLRDSRTPVIASAVAVATNLALNLTLVRVLGFQGLALGTAMAAIVNAAILLVWLRRRLGGLDGRRNAQAVAAIVAASAAMGLAVWLTQHALEGIIAGRGTLVRAVRVFTSIGAGMIVLTGAARLLRIEEFNEALGRVTSRATDGLPRG
ncbi:MAG: murein biosynthesis integral membrane protein MurJ [Acidobacteria bacterium]|nr:MAG: murein biosynthesis integral membrane protein MurJ [Acidobacteriota bacterium]